MKTILFLMLCSLSVRLIASSCEISPAQFSEYLKQDYWTFDQTPRGWRGLDNGSPTCTLAMAQLIDSYYLTNAPVLKPPQTRMLYWHAGQNYAWLELRELAITRFLNSFDPTEPEKPKFHWNAYARATIAFLKKDMAALLRAKAEFKPVAPAEFKNFAIVERFIRCFDASYIEAYGNVGACKE